MTRSSTEPAALEAETRPWLGGRLSLAQPKQGYRVAIDAAFLAAAAPLAPGGRALELGTGVGAAALALAARVPEGRIYAVELQAPLAELARENVRANGLAGHISIVEGDIARLPLKDAAYDCVFFNPPYLKPGENDVSPDLMRRIATVEGPGGLDAWIRAAAGAARDGGAVVLIHRADRLPDILSAFAAHGLGGAVALPLRPRIEADANRIIVGARRGRGGRFRLAPGLVLHAAGGGYTPEAAAVLEGRATLDLGLAA